MGEAASRISMEESFHQFGGLDTIQEAYETSTDTTSEMASQSTNPFTELNAEMGTAESSRAGSRAFRMTLSFLYSNTQGAKIYEDPMGRTCVKIEDSLTEFQLDPLVNYQGDRYVGKDGAMYLVTLKPNEMDKLGKMPSKCPKVYQETPRMQRAVEPVSMLSILTLYLSKEH